MPVPTRKIGGDVSVFTLGGSAFVGDMINATHEIEIKTAEGKGVADTDDYPVPVGRRLTITGELMVAGSVNLMGTANSSLPTITFSSTTGAGTYSGTAVITNISHKVEREGLQTFNVTLVSKSSFSVVS